MVQADTLSDEQHGSALGYANPRSFRNKRFAIDTQSWIDRQGADALQTTVAPAALKDLAVTTSQPVAVPRASLARSRQVSGGMCCGSLDDGQALTRSTVCSPGPIKRVTGVQVPWRRWPRSVSTPLDSGRGPRGSGAL